jgi:radical SAM protein with 4Fe4S-binding SPASM domain
MIELTNRCNLRCITCAREYELGKQMDKGFMDFEHFKKIIDEACPYLDSVGLTGLGETLLYKDIIRAAEYIRQKNKGIVISISTNAHTNNFREQVIQLIPLVDTVQISIDGLDEIYEKVRINAHFNTFHENLRTIVKLAHGTTTDIMFNMVVLKENYFQIADVLHFAHQEGIRYVNVTPINLVALPELNTGYLKFFDSPEFLKEWHKAQVMARNYPEIEFTYPNFKKNTHRRMCRYPWNYFYISWDGYMPPCCAKPFPKELNFGNVFDDGLINVLNSKKFRDFRKIWLEKNIPSFCERC